jgi:MFS family permease
MTTALDTAPSYPVLAPATLQPARPRLVTRALMLRFVSIIGASASFYLLLSVVPLYARDSASNAAGIVTGALMAATVLGEMATPRLVSRFGYRGVLAAGLLLLGAPAFALSASSGIGLVVAVCLVRGLGFAFTVVAGGALTVSLIPAERRGEGLALVGIVGGVPALIALPLGVWLSAHAGYSVVFVLAAVSALVALGSVPGIPDREAEQGQPVGMVAAMKNGAIVWPGVIFATTAMAAGIIVSFLPLAVTHASGGVVAFSLLLHSAASTLGRWLAGRLGDRHSPAHLLVPGVLVAAAGMVVLAFVGVPAAVLTGAVLFGFGFGVTQNASLSLMYERSSVSGYSAVSALWNLAYDAGMGVGAAGFGLLAPVVGYPVAFALTALPMVLVLLRTARA